MFNVSHLVSTLYDCSLPTKAARQASSLPVDAYFVEPAASQSHAGQRQPSDNVDHIRVDCMWMYEWKSHAMSSTVSIASGLMLALVAATNPGCVPNCLGATPPRGARTWNSVRDVINQSFVIASIQGLAAQLPGGGSLLASGYGDFGIDDGWEACGLGVNGSYHDPDGFPMINTTRFPNMAAIPTAGAVLNITTGWYMNACGCGAGEHALSAPHYREDAFTAAALGFRGLKVDSCGNEPNISAWAAALTAAHEAGIGVPVVLENCNDDMPFRPSKRPDGTVDCPYNFFRTSIDGAPNFRSTIWNVYQTLPFLDVSSPGCFAYPDMLTIGIPAPGYGGSSFIANCNGTRLSDAEARAHFAAFAVLSSPLVLGFDVSSASERAAWAPIVTHASSLAINAAWDGEAGRLVAQSAAMATVTVAVGGVCELLQNYTQPEWLVVGKRLAHRDSDGATTRFAAVALVGDYAGAVDIVAPLAAMGFPAGATVSSTDGWSGADTGDVTGAWQLSAAVAPSGAYRVFSLK